MNPTGDELWASSPPNYSQVDIHSSPPNYSQFADSYNNLFDDVPEERENDIFAGEIWASSPPNYSQVDIVDRPEPGAVPLDNMEVPDDDNVNLSIFEHSDHDPEILTEQEDAMEGKPSTVSIYELKLMYKKVLGATIAVFIFCTLALILAVLRRFYTWRGITFNLIVIFSCILGMKCGIYNDHLSSNHAVQKLKLLLIYWCVLCVFVALIFCIFISYAFIMPIRYHDDPKYSTLTVASSTIAYLFGITFWFIFVAFYVDLVARACLKRGRIEYIIMRITSYNHHAVNVDNTAGLDKQNKWFKMYRLVINYRFFWRKMRTCFTSLTAIRCLFDKDHIIKDKEHEEQRVIAMLQEGTNVDKESLKVKCKAMNCDCCTNVMYCLLLPFICCYKGVLQSGILCMNCCGGCWVKVFECGGSVDIGSCCVVMCGGMCCLLGIWIGFPLLLWILISSGFMVCLFVLSSSREHSTGYWALGCGCMIGTFIFFPLWFRLICPVPYDLSSEDWNWDEQCNMWSYVLYFAVQIMVAMAGGDSVDYSW